MKSIRLTKGLNAALANLATSTHSEMHRLNTTARAIRSELLAIPGARWNFAEWKVCIQKVAVFLFHGKMSLHCSAHLHGLTGFWWSTVNPRLLNHLTTSGAIDVLAHVINLLLSVGWLLSTVLIVNTISTIVLRVLPRYRSMLTQLGYDVILI